MENDRYVAWMLERTRTRTPGARCKTEYSCDNRNMIQSVHSTGDMICKINKSHNSKTAVQVNNMVAHKDLKNETMHRTGSIWKQLIFWEALVDLCHWIQTWQEIAGKLLERQTLLGNVSFSNFLDGKWRITVTSDTWALSFLDVIGNRFFPLK